MIRKFLLPLFLLFSIVSFAQDGSASPYSFFGVGDVRFKGTNEINAMAGLSIAPDSIHLNIQNPASYSGLKLSTFTIGGSSSATNFKSNTSNDKANRIALDYFAIGLPLKKFGVALGLIPYATTGYNIKTIDNVNDIIRRYTGKGGLNKVFAGIGYQFTPSLSLGADFMYNFGRIETDNIKYVAASQFGTEETNVSDMSGFNINIGAMYNHKINKKLDFYSGITYTPQSNLNTNNSRNIFTIQYLGDLTPAPIDYFNTQSSLNKIKLPSKLSIGAGLGESKKWLFGAQVTFQESSTFSNRLSDITNVKYENAVKYTLGGYYIPNYSSFSNYFKKVTYRGGFRYENTGLIINNEPINDYAMTAGIGLPIGGSFSNINLGIELGKRGTTKANLVQENYANIIISLSLNDKWFVKRKYD